MHTSNINGEDFKRLDENCAQTSVAVSISQMEANKRVKLKQLRQNCTVVLLTAVS